MISKVCWALWAIVPVVVLAFHFGPGQERARLDMASDLLSVAYESEGRAGDLQGAAHVAQLATFEARKAALLSGDAADEAAAGFALEREQDAYAKASDAWKEAADRYLMVQTALGEHEETDEIRWARARALVRSGEVFNGINELQSLLDAADSRDDSESPLAIAAREELAAAYYYGARLLREEGRPATVWRDVCGTARQQYRYLAERAIRLANSADGENLQHNLERVLDLEQLAHDEMVARPLPKDSPRCRRPGDCEPGQCKGRGKKPGEKPGGNGAGPLLEIGPGW